MEPRGQLWFALEALCQDFLTCSGLGEKDALQTLVSVLANMLAEQENALQALTATPTRDPTGS